MPSSVRVKLSPLYHSVGYRPFSSGPRSHDQASWYVMISWKFFLYCAPGNSSSRNRSMSALLLPYSACTSTTFCVMARKMHAKQRNSNASRAVRSR